MRITVILCTYNRCQSLVRALDSVAVSRLPRSVEWEVLVVDNNSADQTRNVVEDFCRRYPGRFRYLFEPQPGKSHALNSGILAARGDVLAFMDDDVIVEPMWLQNLTVPLHNGQWAGVGGRISPQWTCSPPPWIPFKERYGLGPLVMFDLGPEAGPLAEPPFGTNMAFRRTIFEKYSGFRRDLGPHPGSEIRGEDTEFGNRLLRAGEQLWYEPSAVVYHQVPPYRLRQQYFLTWWFDKARGDIRESGIPQGTRWVVAGIPLYMFRRLSIWTLRWIVSVRPSRRFSCKLNVWRLAGGILESYQQSHTRGTDGKRA
ncbi:MAG TPA: glycosyltransferase [Terriglobales bacterium]|jgi:glycosyltransferase involved in cell wall biosynthesis|nr:glycosyltransferase [Terriglobales bacterium]